MALEFLLLGTVAVGLESELADLGLAFGTCGLTGLGAFVAAYMDVFRREYVDHFGKHVVDKLIG